MANVVEELAEAPGAVPEEFVEQADADTRQYVTFIAGGEVFAVDMAPVLEIIRVPDVVRVPLAPQALNGLANLRGKVLPIISLRRIFGFADSEYDDATRALVIDIGQPLGFIVDRVASVVGVEQEKLESVDVIRSTINTDLLSGIIKDVGGHAMIMVLDFDKLIATEFQELAALAQQAQHALHVTDQTAGEDDPDENSDELQLVSFDVAGQEYAIAIEDVQEIVQLPDSVVHIPRAESHVLGVMTLRQRLLPLVSLRCMFGLPAIEDQEHCRIVVVAFGNASVGIVMDSVNEVLRVHRTQVDAMPGLLAKEGELADISRICRLDDGKRLVSIITASNLFDHAFIQEALSRVDTLHEDALQDGPAAEGDVDDDEQVVVFLLDREEFGVPIDSVQEIVRVPDELTFVPKAPPCVEGVINLRGSVLPVIDLRRRFGLPTIERNESQRVMVFLIAGVCTGFIVDSVAEVLRIHKSAIEASPRLSDEQAKLLARMANLEKQKRMVQLVDPKHLIERQDLEKLAALKV